jgi:hypothetical protein
MKQESRRIFRAFYTRIDGQGGTMFPLLFELITGTAAMPDMDHFNPSYLGERRCLTEQEIEELFNDKTPRVDISRPGELDNFQKDITLAKEFIKLGYLEEASDFVYDYSKPSFDYFFYKPTTDAKKEEEISSLSVFHKPEVNSLTPLKQMHKDYIKAISAVHQTMKEYCAVNYIPPTRAFIKHADGVAIQYSDEGFFLKNFSPSNEKHRPEEVLESNFNSVDKMSSLIHTTEKIILNIKSQMQSLAKEINERHKSSTDVIDRLNNFSFD